ncbi:MAG: hypothetical protein O9350_11555 [Microcystis sp. LE19-388.1G]|nr:hypothetical protein [Microcystis sp. LE19-388.1G]
MNNSETKANYKLYRGSSGVWVLAVRDGAIASSLPYLEIFV